jgi:hypothetical protein
MIRGRVYSCQAEHLDGGLFCIYYTHRMDHERAHIQVMPCVVAVTSKEIIRYFFHLLSTDIVHAKRQHDNVICKKYLMLNPSDVLQKIAV